MEFGHWLSLTAVLLLGAMSPGPSVAVVIGNTMRGGASHGYLTSIGHGAGIALYAILTLAGLAVLLAGSPRLFLVLQVLGSLYLLWLGIKSMRSQGGSLDDNGHDTAGHGPAVSGFLIAFLNPKVAVFMLALFSQFLDPQAGMAQKGLMVATAGSVDAAWYALVVAMVSREAFLRRLRDNAKVIDRILGVILVIVALSVLARAVLEFNGAL